jgi:hypothetical protein
LKLNPNKCVFSVPSGKLLGFIIRHRGIEDLQDNASTIEDLKEKNSRTLGNYSRRLQDYSRIS